MPSDSLSQARLNWTWLLADIPWRFASLFDVRILHIPLSAATASAPSNSIWCTCVSRYHWNDTSYHRRISIVRIRKSFSIHLSRWQEDFFLFVNLLQWWAIELCKSAWSTKSRFCFLNFQLYLQLHLGGSVVFFFKSTSVRNAQRLFSMEFTHRMHDCTWNSSCYSGNRVIFSGLRHCQIFRKIISKHENVILKRTSYLTPSLWGVHVQRASCLAAPCLIGTVFGIMIDKKKHCIFIFLTSSIFGSFLNREPHSAFWA